MGPNIILFMSCWLAGVGIHYCLTKVENKIALVIMVIVPLATFADMAINPSVIQDINKQFITTSSTIYEILGVSQQRASLSFLIKGFFFCFLFVPLVATGKLIDRYLDFPSRLLKQPE